MILLQEDLLESMLVKRDTLSYAKLVHHLVITPFVMTLPGRFVLEHQPEIGLPCFCALSCLVPFGQWYPIMYFVFPQSTLSLTKEMQLKTTDLKSCVKQLCQILKEKSFYWIFFPKLQVIQLMGEKIHKLWGTWWFHFFKKFEEIRKDPVVIKESGMGGCNRLI